MDCIVIFCHLLVTMCKIGHLFVVLRNYRHFPGLAVTDATQPAEMCLIGHPEMTNCVCGVTTPPIVCIIKLGNIYFMVLLLRIIKNVVSLANYYYWSRLLACTTCGGG